MELIKITFKWKNIKKYIIYYNLETKQKKWNSLRYTILLYLPTNKCLDVFCSDFIRFLHLEHNPNWNTSSLPIWMNFIGYPWCRAITWSIIIWIRSNDSFFVGHNVEGLLSTSLKWTNSSSFRTCSKCPKVCTKGITSNWWSLADSKISWIWLTVKAFKAEALTIFPLE